ncbi:hypothetical protein P7K49_027805, partial [Saguinus oedipus]
KTEESPCMGAEKQQTPKRSGCVENVSSAARLRCMRDRRGDALSPLLEAILGGWVMPGGTFPAPVREQLLGSTVEALPRMRMAGLLRLEHEAGLESLVAPQGV